MQVRAFSPLNPALKFPFFPGKYIFTRVDHCQYVSPRDVTTTCLLVDLTKQGFDQCKKLMTNTPNNAPMGANIVPYENPPSVLPAYANEINIPYLHEMCVNSPSTLFTSSPVFSPVPFSSWQKVIDSLFV